MNVGARSISTGSNYASKAALKRALAADPSDVLFYSTELFTTEADAEFRASEIAPGTARLDIVGPDPYRSRKYYGNLTVSAAKGIRLT